MKIEVGMLCRMNDGAILKVDNISKDETGWYVISLGGVNMHTPSAEVIGVKSASFNIIDLIEVGDVIEFMVINDKWDKGIIGIPDEEFLKKLHEDDKIKILKIVTKEQFKSAEFEVDNSGN